MVTGGYSSVSYLYSAAEAIAEQGTPAFIYYFGDWNPSGRDITRATEQAFVSLLGMPACIFGASQ